MIEIDKVEELVDYHVQLSSPFETGEGLFLVASNGDILRWHNESLSFQISGQPNSLCINPETMDYFIADFAHQSVIRRSMQDDVETIENEIKDYKGQPLLGPNSLTFLDSINTILFTDSGAFGETSIENPLGSVFAFDFEENQLKPLSFRTLAYPSGLAVTEDEKALYVCETGRNRVLRFSIQNLALPAFSVFYQLSGGFGPTAVAIKGENVYVGVFQFSQLSDVGRILVLSGEGQIVERLDLGRPQITGICFSRINPNVLYVTDSTKGGSMVRVTFKSEDNSESGDNGSLRNE